MQLFFIASALTLCMSWHARVRQESAPVRNFYLRRAFRILPMFHLAILFYVLFYGVGPRYWAPDGLHWWFAPLTALCLHAFHPETINSVVPGGWSIGVEMTFYLVLPLVFRHLQSPLSLVGMLLLSWLVLLVGRGGAASLLSMRYPPDQQYLLGPFFTLTFLGQLPVFVIGLLTYQAYKLIPSALRRNVGALGIAAFVLAKLVIRYESRLGQLLTDHVVVSVVFACLALLLSAWPRSPLVNRPVIWLGRLSFSMYLAHFAIIDLLQTWLVHKQQRASDLAWFALYLAVVILAALFAKGSYAWVEQRGIIMGKRTIDRLEARAKLHAARWAGT